MTGARVPIQLGHGGYQHPECKGLCRGHERDRTHSPSMFLDPRGTPDRRVGCMCCNHVLRQAKPGESGLSDGAMLSLMEGVTSRGRVMVDDICRYDVVVLAELKAVGDKGI